MLATDGREVHAEELESGEILVCDHSGLPDHFGFFLPLAGITTVKQIRDSALDIRATGRLESTLCRASEGESRVGGSGTPA